MLAPRDRGFLGADGALSIQLDEKRILWVFGDSTLGRKTKSGERQGPMIHNSIAIQTRGEAGGDQVEFIWKLPDKLPGDFFPPEDLNADFYYWPGTGFVHQGTLYLILTKVGPGQGAGGFAFSTIGATLFKISNPQDHPNNWKMTSVELGYGNDHFNINAAALVEAPYLYLLGYHDGPENKPLDRAAILCRLPLGSLAKPLPGADLEFWTKHATWESTTTAMAPLFKPGATETSLFHDKKRGLYVSVAMTPFKPEIFLAHAKELTGPWEISQSLYDIPEYKADSKNHAYAGRAHPWLQSSDDEYVLTYVVNTSDFWSMFKNLTIYYPRFLKITLE